MVFGKELVLALVLVTTGEPVEDGQQVPLAACRQVAVQMQLLDVAELPYYFRETDQEGYIRSDLECIRGRYQRGRDFPRVEEVNLPPAEFCEQMRLLLRQRECWCRQQIGMEARRDFAWYQLAADYERRANIWCALGEAAKPQYVFFRRSAMATVIELMGAEDFWACHWPLPY